MWWCIVTEKQYAHTHLCIQCMTKSLSEHFLINYYAQCGLHVNNTQFHFSNNKS